MENGEWRMENEEWRMKNEEWAKFQIKYETNSLSS